MATDSVRILSQCNSGPHSMSCLEMIMRLCPVCKCDSVDGGVKYYEALGKTAMRVGYFCVLCPYERWTYVNEAFLHDTFKEILLSDELGIRETAINTIKNIEDKISAGDCQVIFKSKSSIQFLSPSGKVG